MLRKSNNRGICKIEEYANMQSQGAITSQPIYKRWRAAGGQGGAVSCKCTDSCTGLLVNIYKELPTGSPGF